MTRCISSINCYWCVFHLDCGKYLCNFCFKFHIILLSHYSDWLIKKVKWISKSFNKSSMKQLLLQDDTPWIHEIKDYWTYSYQFDLYVMVSRSFWRSQRCCFISAVKSWKYPNSCSRLQQQSFGEISKFLLAYFLGWR